MHCLRLILVGLVSVAVFENWVYGFRGECVIMPGRHVSLKVRLDFHASPYQYSCWLGIITSGILIFHSPECLALRANQYYTCNA